jgi:hypothetical protein
MAKYVFRNYQLGLYNDYLGQEPNPLSFTDFMRLMSEYKYRKDKYLVYVGYSKKDKDCSKIIYVGTTIQFPLSRWYYHKTHGKNLVFKEYKRFDNEKDMLELEYELIKKYRPSCNKITDRPQNFNVALDEETLESRKGNPEWCQCCLKRRVSDKRYKTCYWCAQLI